MATAYCRNRCYSVCCRTWIGKQQYHFAWSFIHIQSSCWEPFIM